MNILLIIFLAPIALFAGIIALGLFIRFFWMWAGLGLAAVVACVGYMCWWNAGTSARDAAFYASPEGQQSLNFAGSQWTTDGHGHLQHR